MVQILLIHNRLNWHPVTWLSYLIRVFTCSKWNHIAIKVNGEVIESIGKGVILTDWEVWLKRGNRIVLPLIPDVQPDYTELLTLKGKPYGFLDLVQILRYIKATRWDGKPEWQGKNYNGYICSELACILLGLKGFFAPADFEYMTGFIKLPEFETCKTESIT